MTTAPTDYTELRKAAEAAQHDGDEDSCCVLGLMHDQIIALLDAHATVVAERDAAQEQTARMRAHVRVLTDAVIGMGANAIALKCYAEAFTGEPLKSHLVGIAQDIDATARSAYETTWPKTQTAPINMLDFLDQDNLPKIMWPSMSEKPAKEGE